MLAPLFMSLFVSMPYFVHLHNGVLIVDPSGYDGRLNSLY
jgi:hypothetical protein